MILWRVSAFADLSGAGGLHVSGRWHNKGKPIVYASESVALALLEVLAQVEDRVELPLGYQLLQIEAGQLPVTRWDDPLPPLEESRAWGDRWLTAQASPLANVPAAVAPHSRNWLINPAHPAAAALTLLSAEQWQWDNRLLP
ncbi:RES family NAD+ phosphorylase [Sphingomonas sp. KRR8]|uniref:RES family NAD+ phosphorylase n=1 Tax=Sphingomonas sp. KRR8 TaxID=2942996 RepID=UPI0020227331|nr:RES family NAD+ phosphorylase [Sphingomonas sp. KRR8]URD61283.1 RES family NAD+ phosphorylase [Sphingomonas sp. KRR8]